MLILILISLATASMTLTLSRSKLFAPVRMRMPGWIATPWRCHYCLGHWVALAWVLTCAPEMQGANKFSQVMLAWFAVVAMASFMMGLILLVVPMKGDDVS